jgi:hypothetical protein
MTDDLVARILNRLQDERLRIAPTHYERSDDGDENPEYGWDSEDDDPEKVVSSPVCKQRHRR